MNSFNVWIRPLGSNCRVRVDSIKNAKWLLDRLSRSFVFKSSEPINEDRSSSFSDFRVPYSSQMCHRTFEKLLSAIPEVRLMTEPA